MAALDAAAFALLMAPLGPFEPAPHIAVGVSGGADSLALALLVAGWAAAEGGRATALTVDHGLRPESAAEARRVHRWLAARGIPHHVLRWQGPRPAADLQAAARAARYRLLGGWCARHGVLHLAVAHHRDDQAETLLLRLARGSGLDGLAAMAPIAELAGDPGAPGVRLLRPLLDVPKVALEATLRAAGQDWIADPSNASTAFARVRLRRLLPALAEEGLTPARLAATARRLGRARAALDDGLAALLAAAVALHPAGYATLDLARWREAPTELRLRGLARCLITVGGAGYTPRLERLERLAGWLLGDEPGAGRVRTLAGCRVERRGAAALIAREAAGADEEIPLALAAGEYRTVIWDGRFRLRLAGPGRARLCRLGAAGWTVVSAAPGAAQAAVPAPARLSLPALWDRNGLLAAPTLGWRRPGARGPRVARAEFAPAQPLAGCRFMVV